MEVSHRPDHPTADQLQDLLERSLDSAQQSVVEAHVAECTDCRLELEELRALFGALSSLPRFAPAPAFADAVMAKVRVRQPAFAGVNAWVERVTPHTTRGWAAAVAVLALPVVGATLLVAWILSRPGVTPQGLWTVATSLAEQGASSGWQWAWARFAGTSLAAWVVQAAELIQSVGRAEIGLVAAMFMALTFGSAYVLYQNLFRSEPRRSENATYVF